MASMLSVTLMLLFNNVEDHKSSHRLQSRLLWYDNNTTCAATIPYDTINARS